MLISTLSFMATLAMSIPMQMAAITPGSSQRAYVDDKWLLTYQGKTTNQVRWDKRLPDLLRRGIPRIHTSFYDVHMYLPDVALVALSGPPEDVSIELDRYVTLAACVPQVGPLKGLLWVDTGGSHDEMIFVALDQDSWHTTQASVAMYTRSNQLAAKIPPQFLSSLTVWLSTKGIKQITDFTMTNAEGKITHPPLAILGSY